MNPWISLYLAPDIEAETRLVLDYGDDVWLEDPLALAARHPGFFQ